MSTRSVQLSVAATIALIVAFGLPGPASATHETDGMTEHVVTNDLGSMSYLLFVPPGLPVGAPLFMHVHGGNNKASDAAHRSGLNDLAREYGLAVAYPQEDPAAGNNGIWDSATAAEEGRGSRATSLLAQITREVVADRDLDASRVFIGGISAGSGMALVEAAQYPELYAGLQDEAGAKYGTGKEGEVMTDPPGVDVQYTRSVEETGRTVYDVMGSRARRIPIIRSTGTADPFHTQPDQQGTVEHWMVARDWIDDGERNESVSTTPTSSRTGEDGKTYTVTEWADENGCLFGQEWVIDGMFHSYSGGRPTQTRDVTADPDAPDMRRVAIEFFLDQTAPGGPTACRSAVAGGAPSSDGDWFSAWSRPQNIAIAASADAVDGGRGPTPLVDQTVRNIVRVSAAGSALRLHLGNRYGATLEPDGTTPLQVQAVTVARRTSGADVDLDSVRVVTFAGEPGTVIEPGGTVVSDPVDLAVEAHEDIAVSVHVARTEMAPSHGASFVTSWVAPAGSGDHTADIDGSAFTEPTFATLVLNGVDVLSRELRGVVAATGSSVTDGHGSDIDGHNDFPSWLGLRTQQELPSGQRMAVVNTGLGGSMAATACSTPVSGPAVEERVGHDSLQLPGITHLVIYAGTNDIGGGCSGADIMAGMRSTIDQARERGVKVLISTITPRASYTEVQNVQREIVNAWLRHGGNCSGECHRSLDFDAVVRDPDDHNRINPSLDSGDGIHPTGEGYRLIAASIPLDAMTAPGDHAPPMSPAPIQTSGAVSPTSAPAPTTSSDAGQSMLSQAADAGGTLPATGGGSAVPLFAVVLAATLARRCRS